MINPLPIDDLSGLGTAADRTKFGVLVIAIAVCLSAVLVAGGLVLTNNANTDTVTKVAQIQYNQALGQCVNSAKGRGTSNTNFYALQQFLQTEATLSGLQRGLQSTQNQLVRKLYPKPLLRRIFYIIHAQQVFTDYWRLKLAPLVKTLDISKNCLATVPRSPGVRIEVPVIYPPLTPLPRPPKLPPPSG